jgi:transposase
MDGFGGYKTAAAEVLPEATSVLDPFHVVASTSSRWPGPGSTCPPAHPTGHLRAPWSRRRPALTGTTHFAYPAPLLNARQKARLEAVFADEAHIAVELCWGFYQRLIAAYEHPVRRRGKTMMTTIIDSLRTGIPDALEELAQLGRTLWRRRTDVLAYFDHHASNGPTEAINGRLEALRRNALGFRNLTPYRLRSLRTAAISSNRSMHSRAGRATKPGVVHSADLPSDSATTPTTSLDRYWKPVDSNPNYTVNHEEPY